MGQQIEQFSTESIPMHHHRSCSILRCLRLTKHNNGRNKKNTSAPLRTRRIQEDAPPIRLVTAYPSHQSGNNDQSFFLLQRVEWSVSTLGEHQSHVNDRYPCDPNTVPNAIPLPNPVFYPCLSPSNSTHACKAPHAAQLPNETRTLARTARHRYNRQYHRSSCALEGIISHLEVHRNMGPPRAPLRSREHVVVR